MFSTLASRRVFSTAPAEAALPPRSPAIAGAGRRPDAGRGCREPRGPAAAAVGAAQPDPLAVFGHVERPVASISVALGDGDGRPADDTAAEESTSAEDGVEAAERAKVNECRQDDEKERREEKAKTLRLKKLLSAADKRLQQAESDLDVRDAEIAALKYRLSLDS